MVVVGGDGAGCDPHSSSQSHKTSSGHLRFIYYPHLTDSALRSSRLKCWVGGGGRRWRVWTGQLWPERVTLLFALTIINPVPGLGSDQAGRHTRLGLGGRPAAVTLMTPQPHPPTPHSSGPPYHRHHPMLRHFLHQSAGAVE